MSFNSQHPLSYTQKIIANHSIALKSTTLKTTGIRYQVDIVCKYELLTFATKSLGFDGYHFKTASIYGKKKQYP
jgi:hypothetical protein